MKNRTTCLNEEVRDLLSGKNADFVQFVDISALPPHQTRGFDAAVLVCSALSRKFVADVHAGLPTKSDEFLEKELFVDELADRLALHIRQKGFRACSQSEKSNLENGLAEGGYADPELRSGIATLPHKTVARLSGLGFIGKNNLLVTEAFGCALSLCTVLTDAPFRTENPPPQSVRCGACRTCVDVCPAGALSGAGWTPEGGRESLLDISKCSCALKCMTACPWTRRYARAR